MKPGRKPKPVALRDRAGPDAPIPPDGMPRCPGHLSKAARAEWRRLAKTLHGMGVLTTCDRGAFAAYCQAWARWVEAEEKLQTTPMLIRMPSGYVQQSPWLSIANKQIELMGRYMTEMGLTPSARTRVSVRDQEIGDGTIIFKTVYEYADGSERDIKGNVVPDNGKRPVN
ncbi:phage terminase small subunit P27 family [Algicella marina]|uniref:Phage terminase small subunit P27 family n=1 Tax=Algicella marina TaxID=2683284 RepID=A0A6P1T0A2_9RHOB|nr:phage terminase small subunit P27 family [Algicella marina]QHQ35437.1 phage terminase small subunit P27 family [Algicella marina]